LALVGHVVDRRPGSAETEHGDLIWHAYADRDPGFQWLRDQVKQVQLASDFEWPGEVAAA
jgi:hypothetical protein